MPKQKAKKKSAKQLEAEKQKAIAEAEAKKQAAIEAERQAKSNKVKGRQLVLKEKELAEAQAHVTVLKGQVKKLKG